MCFRVNGMTDIYFSISQIVREEEKYHLKLFRRIWFYSIIRIWKRFGYSSINWSWKYWKKLNDFEKLKIVVRKKNLFYRTSNKKGQTHLPNLTQLAFQVMELLIFIAIQVCYNSALNNTILNLNFVNAPN